MKTLVLIKTTFKCSHCNNEKTLSFGYTDGILELCIEHAMAELSKPEPTLSILEKYFERISSKEKQ
jgi:hypothetical protein